MRHLAIGGGTLRELNQLRAPMSQIFDIFQQQTRELERYRQKYGELSDSEVGDTQTNGHEPESESGQPSNSEVEERRLLTSS